VPLEGGASIGNGRFTAAQLGEDASPEGLIASFRTRVVIERVRHTDAEFASVCSYEPN